MKRNARILLSVLVCSALALAALLPAVSCERSRPGPAAHAHEVIYQCPMHPSIMQNKPGTCPICGMALVPMKEAMPDSTAKAVGSSAVYVDRGMTQAMAVQTEQAELRSLAPQARLSATVQADERRVQSVSTRVDGFIEKMYVAATGQAVRAGESLYDLYSPDLVAAQAEYLQVLHSPSGDSLAQLAAGRLTNWGMPQSQIEKLRSGGSPLRTVTFFAPAGGVATEKNVVQGQQVQAGMQLYRIVDYSHVWVVGEAFQQDAPLLKVGRPAEITVDFAPGRAFNGTISWVSPSLDPTTRTIQVRVDVANSPAGELKPGMTATMRIAAAAGAPVLSVSEQAVIHTGSRTLVMVATGGGHFAQRDLSLGTSADGFVQVTTGLSAGEQVVTSGQFLLDAESNFKSAAQKLK
jgi:Cu(I)/Ag(I) efflux system membrane fusion protein